MCDIAFKKENTVIPRDASVGELMGAAATTLRLSNQKNGIRGSIIHRSAMVGEYFPIKAVVKRFLHIQKNNVKKYRHIIILLGSPSTESRNHQRYACLHLVRRHQTRSYLTWHYPRKSRDTLFSCMGSDGTGIRWSREGRY